MWIERYQTTTKHYSASFDLWRVPSDFGSQWYHLLKAWASVVSAAAAVFVPAAAAAYLFAFYLWWVEHGT